MSRKKDQPGTFELLARLPGQIIALAKAEYENAKREIAKKAKRAGIGAAAFVIALFFLFWAIAAFGAAAIGALALVWPIWLSALVVAVGLVLLAVAAVLLGIWFIKRGVPVPEETIDRIERDVNALSEVRFNASSHAARGADHENRMPQADQKGNWR